MKMTDKLFRAIMRNLHAYVLLINRDFTVFYTNYYDITGAVKPAETGRVGDILRCNNALSAAGGCGTHDLCEHCPVRNAIENAFVVQKNFTDLAAILNLRDSEGRTTECNAYVSGEYMEIEDRDCMGFPCTDILGYLLSVCTGHLCPPLLLWRHWRCIEKRYSHQRQQLLGGSRRCQYDCI